jgi:protein tyrosine/serine phosphatase
VGDAATSSPARRRRRLSPGRAALIALGVAAVTVGVSWALMKTRVLRAPYPPAGQAYARLLGGEEEAFNVAVVEPGRIYRSGQPDSRLIRHLHDRYGIRRMIILNGAEPDNARPRAVARELGIEVHTFKWSSHRKPPADQREQVLALLAAGGPTLVHCSAGSDRTGLAVAMYRVRVQGWPIERAIEEMETFWHDAEARPAMQAALRESAVAPTTAPEE